MSGFTLVDFTVPTREVAMTHSPGNAPLCEDCQSLDLCFFNPLCPGCQDILLDSNTTIPELFAVMRQWVPQIQRNMSSLMREVLRRGANVNDRDGLTGLSLLHYACKSGAAGVGNITAATNLVISLISKGADTEARCRWTDMNSMHYAVYFDASDVVQVLAEQNPSLLMSTCSEFSNGTSLHLAATNLSLSSAKVLLQNGADGSVTDDNGRKPYELIPDNIPNELEETSVELSQLLKNAAENPPLGRSKKSKSKSSSRKTSPCPTPLPAPLVISRQPDSGASTPSKAAAPAVPKSPAPSNNSTISTTSTQHTATGSLSSRAHSPALSDVTMASLNLKVGDRIVIDSNSAKPKYGTIRFGGTTEFHPGQWAGIELDKEIGKNDGSYGGIRYFSCKPKFGLFVPMHRISPVSKDSAAEKKRRHLVKTKDTPRVTPTITTSLVREAQLPVKGTGEIQIGERVRLSGNRVGTLRFSGLVKFDPGLWMGVELDTPTGKNDGSKDNVRYFKCRPNYGVFVPKSKVKRLGPAEKITVTASGALTTPISSGAESVDYPTSGSVSLATSGASGSSEAEGSSPPPHSSPSVARRKIGASSRSSNRSTGTHSKQSFNSSGGAGSLSSSTSPDIILSCGMSVFANKEMGVVRFIGNTEFAEGVWLGVELRKPVGKNDGTVQGKQYFHCKANHGLFVKPEKATHRGINCSKILPREFSNSSVL